MNSASGRLRTGSQSLSSSSTGNTFSDKRAAGLFVSMICDREGNGDCNANSHWVQHPDLDGSRLSKNRLVLCTSNSFDDIRIIIGTIRTTIRIVLDPIIFGLIHRAFHCLSMDYQ